MPGILSKVLGVLSGGQSNFGHPTGVLADPSLGLMGSVKPDARSLKMYALSAPYLADRLDDPAKLMEYIDIESKRESTRSGEQYNGYAIKAARDALANLYGINNYPAKGFLVGDESRVNGSGYWQEPRPFMGDSLLNVDGFPMKYK